VTQSREGQFLHFDLLVYMWFAYRFVGHSTSSKEYGLRIVELRVTTNLVVLLKTLSKYKTDDKSTNKHTFQHCRN